MSMETRYRPISELLSATNVGGTLRPRCPARVCSANSEGGRACARCIPASDDVDARSVTSEKARLSVPWGGFTDPGGALHALAMRRARVVRLWSWRQPRLQAVVRATRELATRSAFGVLDGSSVRWAGGGGDHAERELSTLRYGADGRASSGRCPHQPFYRGRAWPRKSISVREATAYASLSPSRSTSSGPRVARSAGLRRPSTSGSAVR